MNEFETLRDNDMLPTDPVTVDRTIPDVPAGLEEFVEDFRDDINTNADALADTLTFNEFAFNFVCEESIDEIMTVQAAADQ